VFLLVLGQEIGADSVKIVLTDIQKYEVLICLIQVEQQIG
jgi:hypothetical protein